MIFSKTSRCVLKSLTLMMQQRIGASLVDPRSAADHDHWRFLGVGAGDGIGQAQSADAIRHADRSHAVDAGVAVGRVARAVFARAFPTTRIGLSSSMP